MGNIKLIIAEKPSLARNIADGIGGSFVRRDGYMQSGEYIVTWAFGHLFSLADVEYYSENERGSAVPQSQDNGFSGSSPAPEGQKNSSSDYVGGGRKRRWTLDELPCFPGKFKFVLRRAADNSPDKGVEKQFSVIRSLCERSDVDTIINAGDADREGEIIVRLCIMNSDCSGKKLLRLWLPDQTPQTVKAALDDMKDESEYDNLANEGFARTYIDWLYGINLTRYASIKSGSLLRVGRVLVPVVKAIYERDVSIENFVPKEYLAIVSREKTAGEVVELVSEHEFDPRNEADALALCKEYNALAAVVTSVSKKTEKLSAGKLYSLSKLQGFLAKKYKMEMTESLQIVQRLYEKGYLTYPRTNSEYLASAEKEKISDIISRCSSLGYPVVLKESKKIFDDSKIESHSAITPTYKIPSKESLSENEYRVYSAVFRRFVAVFCSEDAVVERNEITIDLSGRETFTLKGVSMKSPGWTKYDEYTGKDKILPRLKKGDEVAHVFSPQTKKTSAPKHYTTETLNNYLKNPFRNETSRSDDDTEEYKAMFEGIELGTEATRTGIIDNARKSGYIDLSRNTYTILPGGRYLVETLDRLGINMDKYKTSELGRALKKVFRSEMSVDQSVKIACSEIAEVFSKKDRYIERRMDLSADKKECTGGVIARCPVCGSDIREGKGMWGCTGKGCSVAVYKTICSKKLSWDDAAALFSGGTVGEYDFVSKGGKEFRAKLTLENGRIKFIFPR